MRRSYLVMIIIILVVLSGIAVWYPTTRPQQLSSVPAETSIQIVQANTTAPVVYSTSTPTTTPSSNPQNPSGLAPKIDSIAPTKGSPGTMVTIHGTGFDKNTNFVLFGTSNGRHHPDGSPDNSRGNVTSADGKTLTFQVPNSGPSGILCDASNRCVGIMAILLSPGAYSVQVTNKNGASNMIQFTLSK